TIFIENEQIEELSNRPPWTGVTVEVGMSDGLPQHLRMDEGVTYTDNVIHHVQDVGACYFRYGIGTASRPIESSTTTTSFPARLTDWPARLATGFGPHGCGATRKQAILA